MREAAFLKPNGRQFAPVGRQGGKSTRWQRVVSGSEDNFSRELRLWAKQHPDEWAELEKKLSPAARRERQEQRAREANQRFAEAVERWSKLSPEQQQLEHKQWLYDILGGGYVLGVPGARLPRPGETVSPQKETPAPESAAAPTPPKPSQPKQTHRKRELHGQSPALVKQKFCDALRNGPPGGGRWGSLFAACRHLLNTWAGPNGLAGTYSTVGSLTRAMQRTWDTMPKRHKPQP
jgi:hypothetical protein